MGDLNNNLKCYKMNDCVLNSMLVQKHEQIQEFGCYVQVQVYEWNQECDCRVGKLILVVQDILHHHHRSTYKWIEHHVEGT